MTASKGSQTALIGIFLAIIACGGTVQAAREWSRGERIQFLDLFRAAPTEEHLRAFERRLEDRAWPAVLSRPAVQYLRYTAFDDLGEKAVAGRDGWLFYRPGVDFLVEPWPVPDAADRLYDDPLPAIVAFRDALAARGIALLVVPAPGKASVYPDRLSRRAANEDRPVYDHMERFFERLDAAGVAYVDLFRLFQEDRRTEGTPDLYMARDTHWTPAGAERAAEAVAKAVLKRGWATPGDRVYNTRPVEVSRTGDILRMVDSPGIARAYPPERVTCAQVVDAATGEPYRDERDSPVLVLGDSFLRIYEYDEPGSAGFIAHLARALGRPLTSVVSDGGASTLVRQELRRRPELLEGKKLVVWEFVERDLRFGEKGWREVPLPEIAAQKGA